MIRIRQLYELLALEAVCTLFDLFLILVLDPVLPLVIGPFLALILSLILCCPLLLLEIATVYISMENILKPISPNKPGKFFHDSMDDNFKQVFDQLYNIEVASKQSQVDLSQLVDRLKNNNENLKKLLESLLNSNINARDIIDPIIDELKELHLDHKSQNLLSEILSRLNRENDKEDLRALLVEIRDKQEMIMKTNDLKDKYDDLQNKYTNLQDKYQQLCKMYENKYENLKDLKSQYDELLNDSKENIKPDYKHLDTVEQLHALKLKSGTKRIEKKRIVSTNI